MTGYAEIIEFYRLTEQLKMVNLSLGPPKHHNFRTHMAVVPIKPHPLYADDAEIYAGTMEEIRCWTDGVLAARQYDHMVFGRKHNSNRAKKEQQIMDRRLFSRVVEGRAK